MKFKQVSSFVENTPGRLSEITSLIADSGINIRAHTIADTTNYGILRIIVDDPQRCEQILKQAGLAVSITSVLAIGLEDTPGAFSKALSLLGKSGVSVEYAYVSLMKRGDKICVILKVDDNEKAAAALAEGGIETYSAQ